MNRIHWSRTRSPMSPEDELRLRRAALLQTMPGRALNVVGTSSAASTASTAGRLSAASHRPMALQQQGIPLPRDSDRVACLAAAYRSVELAATLDRATLAAAAYPSASSTVGTAARSFLGASHERTSGIEAFLGRQQQLHPETLLLADLQRQQQALAASRGVRPDGSSLLPSSSWGRMLNNTPNSLASLTTQSEQPHSLLLQLSTPRQQHRDALSSPSFVSANKKRKREDSVSNTGSLPARKRRIRMDNSQQPPVTIAALESVSEHSSRSSSFPLPSLKTISTTTPTNESQESQGGTPDNNDVATAPRQSKIVVHIPEERLPLVSFKMLWDTCKTKTDFLRRLRSHQVPIVKDTSVTGQYSYATPRRSGNSLSFLQREVTPRRIERSTSDSKRRKSDGNE